MKTAAEFIQECRFELRNDAREEKLKAVRLVIEGFVETGLLTEVEAAIYRGAIEVCPGHEDEGYRSWCAYCGNMSIYDYEIYNYDEPNVKPFHDLSNEVDWDLLDNVEEQYKEENIFDGQLFSIYTLVERNLVKEIK